MVIESEKLATTWDIWSEKGLKTFSIKKIKYKDFIHNSVRHELIIYEQSKKEGSSVESFICQCYISISGYKEDLLDTGNKNIKLNHVTVKDFITSIKEVPYKTYWWQKPVWKDVTRIKTVIDIVVIYEWWDWSTYIIEFEDKWQFISISVNY